MTHRTNTDNPIDFPTSGSDFKAADFPVVQAARRAAQAQFAHYYEMMGKNSGLKVVEGNLLDLAEAGDFDIIVQGCNCWCTMGSGIAKQIRERYPQAYEADCGSVPGDYGKLGNYTQARAVRANGTAFSIVNAYTQFNFNRAGENADVFEYISFKLILQKLAHQFPGARFGFPMIGMGLAGGNKTAIMNLLADFAGEIRKTGGTVTVVEFKP